MTRDINSLRELVEWAARAPDGVRIPAELVAQLGTEHFDAVEGPEPVGAPFPGPMEPTWRERLWTAPAETRIGVRELVEALGRSRSWLYRHTGDCAPEDRIPHRKLEGELLFAVGEVRAWLRNREEVVHAGPMEASPHERGLRVVPGGDAA